MADQAIGGEAVAMGRPNDVVAVRAKRAVAMRVREDEEEVWSIHGGWAPAGSYLGDTTGIPLPVAALARR